MSSLVTLGLNLGLVIMLLFPDSIEKYLCPIDVGNRTDIEDLRLSEIGAFGLIRKSRPGIPAHLHTGIDIKRPRNNYDDEPVFPITDGVVISKRTDGPYAQLIIEHDGEELFWTIYEHVSGIRVNLNERVYANQPIARFMNREELNQYGWQFDHFHFEVLKKPPIILKRDEKNPDRRFASFTLSCRTAEELEEHFYDPIDFLMMHMDR